MNKMLHSLGADLETTRGEQRQLDHASQVLKPPELLAVGD
jgi:hypothetical protein